MNSVHAKPRATGQLATTERGYEGETMATETKVTHTPGPWQHEGNEILGGIGSHNAFVVCKLTCGHVSPAPVFSYLNDEQREFRSTVDANARLIAAAPELLEALKLAVSRFEQPEYLPVTLGDIRRMRSLIHRAEGK